MPGSQGMRRAEITAATTTSSDHPDFARRPCQESRQNLRWNSRSDGRQSYESPMRWSARKSKGEVAGVPKRLPTWGTVVPVGTDWLHEIKHDGYRLLVRKDGNVVSVITRGGYDFTDRYPLSVAGALRLRGSFVIDGEGVVCGEDGVADFELLHSRK